MKRLLVPGMVLMLLVAAGCAAGNARFDEAPAGFWAGLWHGLICVVTFIVSLFNDNVFIYETNNTGHLYDLGFIIGAAIAFGGGCGSSCSVRRKSPKEREWDDIGDRVERKVRKGIEEWLRESDPKDKDWDEIGRKVEEKIKRELRNWADS